MSKVNKFLCKWFDIDDKGYVTVGDFIKGIMCIIITILLIIVVIYSVIEFFTNLSSALEEVPPTLSFFMLGGTIVVLFVAFVTIFLISGIIELIKYISNIRISECELKNKKEVEMRPDSLASKYSIETMPLKKEMEEKI